MVTKITDMNSDCIEHVLKLLNFLDLSNVAASNQILCSVACNVILRRYLHKKLTLILDGPQFMTDDSRAFKVENSRIKALNLRAGLKSLYYFGRLYSKIQINYKRMTLRQRKMIELYSGEYCITNHESSSSSLIEIELENCTRDALRWIETPLKSVQKVVVTGNSELNFLELNKKIPKMNFLKLTWLQVTNANCIEHHFPHLKHLEVEVRDRKLYFTEENVQNAVIMNPQLSSIHVKMFKHPESNEEKFVDFLKNNFEAPGKVAYLMK